MFDVSVFPDDLGKGLMAAFTTPELPAVGDVIAVGPSGWRVESRVWDVEVGDQTVRDLGDGVRRKVRLVVTLWAV